MAILDTLSFNPRLILAPLFEAFRMQPNQELVNCVPYLLLIAEKYGAKDAFSQWSPAAISPETDSYFMPYLEQIDEETREEIVDALKDVPVRLMNYEDFTRLFDTALEMVAEVYGPRNTIFDAPYEVEMLAKELVAYWEGEWEGAHICHPYAGTGRLATLFDSDCTYEGLEPQAHLRALGQLRLAAYQLERATVGLDDPYFVMHEGGYGDNTYDAVVCLQPLSNEAVQALTVKEAVSALRGDGQAVVAVFDSYLSASSAYSFRQELIESGGLDTVIELPAGLWPTAPTAAVSLLVLNRSKHHGERVRFCDATALRLRAKRRERILDTEAVAAALASTPMPANVREVTNAELAAQEYNLVARRYTNETPTSANDRLLGELLEAISRPDANRPEGAVRVVSTRDLKTDNLDFSLVANDIQPGEGPQNTLLLLAEDALLLTLQGLSLKPTVFRAQAGPVWLRPSVTAWRVRSDQVDAVDIAYLISELNSGYVENQLRGYRSGSGMPTVRRADLLKIRIRLLSLDEQRAKVEGFREERIKAKRAEIRLLEADRVHKGEAFEQLADLKHALGRPVAGLGASLRNLRSFIEQRAVAGQSIQLENLMSERHRVTVADTFNAMTRQLESIDELLTRSEAELVPENYPKQWIDFYAYLDKLIKDTGTTDPCYELILWNTSGSGSTALIQANEHLLDRLFGHIFNNAARHGFLSTSSPGNAVQIKVTQLLDTVENDILRTEVEIEISNNGRPLPENFGADKLISKHKKAGATGNTGIGGYEVQQIISYIGGRLDLVSAPNELWPVRYVITIPCEPQDFIYYIENQKNQERFNELDMQRQLAEYLADQENQDRFNELDIQRQLAEYLDQERFNGLDMQRQLAEYSVEQENEERFNELDEARQIAEYLAEQENQERFNELDTKRQIAEYSDEHQDEHSTPTASLDDDKDIQRPLD